MLKEAQVVLLNRDKAASPLVDERNVCQAFFDHTVGEDRKDVPAINLWTALFQGRPATPHVRYPQLIYPEQTPHDPDAWNTFLYGNTAP